MREFLVPVFGEWGAVVAQFLLTVIIVFGLIGAVWWFVRRYSGVHFGGIGRGRVPRLAVVDVLAVDRRRKLVLVRRDNVEHLLLVGGPSDVVVEGTIQRVRQRNAQAAAQAAAARAAQQPAGEPPPPAAPAAPQPEPAGAEQRPVNEPVPFPVARSARPQAASGNGPAPLAPERQPPPPAPPPEVPAEPEPTVAAPARTAARLVEPDRPTEAQPMPAPEAAEPEPPQEPPRHEPPQGEPPEHEPPRPEPAEPAAESLLPEVMTADAEALPPPPPTTPPAPATFAEAELEAAEEARQSALDLGDGEAPATAAEPQEPAFAAPERPEAAPADSANRVNDLEREMARLLDEITTRRSS